MSPFPLIVFFCPRLTSQAFFPNFRTICESYSLSFNIYLIVKLSMFIDISFGNEKNRFSYKSLKYQLLAHLVFYIKK